MVMTSLPYVPPVLGTEAYKTPRTGSAAMSFATCDSVNCPAGKAATVNEAGELETGPEPADGEVTTTLTVPAVATSDAGTLTELEVLDVYVGVRVVPPNTTTEPLVKFLPVSVRVKAGDPAKMVDGESAVMVGSTGEIVNCAAFVVLPPEDTVIEAVPTAATFDAGTEAKSCVAETNVVVRALPFQSTDAPEPKFRPFTVS